MGSFETSITIAGEKLTVYGYQPTGTIRGILILFHGVSRTAESYRNYAKPLADRHGLAVYAPLFDLARFPDWRYQRGGLVKDGKILDRWTVDHVHEMVTWAQKRTAVKPYRLFGYSAGAQFLSRVAAYTLPGAEKIVVGAPSTFVLPSLTEPVPYGFGCSNAGCVYDKPEAGAQLKAYLGLPLTITVGAEDVGTEDLSTSESAMRQGANRLERARNTFAAGQRVAGTKGWPFNWQLVVLSGVEHTAKAFLQSGSTDTMFGL